MKFLLVFSFLFVAAGLTVAEDSDEDYSKFINPALMNMLEKYNSENRDSYLDEETPSDLKFSIIDPPPRCKECERADRRGKCRKIVGCVPEGY